MCIRHKLTYADRDMRAEVKHSAVHYGAESRRTDRPQLAGPILSNAGSIYRYSPLFSPRLQQKYFFLVNRSASYLLEEHVPGFWVPRV